MKQAKHIIWGLVLIALGVLYGLNQLHLLPFELFFEGWWTLFIILPSLVALITDPNKMPALIGLLFGVFFLLDAWNVVDGSLLWKLILPILIVLLGIKLLFSRRPQACAVDAPPPAEAPHAVAVFSGQELRLGGQVFRGAEATAIFGGVDCYAQDAIVREDCTIRATAVFGGVDLHLPRNVNVKVVSNGLFGGVENHHTDAVMEGAPTIYVYSTTVFGGVEIH